MIYILHARVLFNRLFSRPLFIRFFTLSVFRDSLFLRMTAVFTGPVFNLKNGGDLILRVHATSEYSLNLNLLENNRLFSKWYVSPGTGPAFSHLFLFASNRIPSTSLAPLGMICLLNQFKTYLVGSDLSLSVKRYIFLVVSRFNLFHSKPQGSQGIYNITYHMT